MFFEFLKYKYIICIFQLYYSLYKSSFILCLKPLILDELQLFRSMRFAYTNAAAPLNPLYSKPNIVGLAVITDNKSFLPVLF